MVLIKNSNYAVFNPNLSDFNIIPNEESNQSADSEGNYHLDAENPDWNVKLKVGSSIEYFVHQLNSRITDMVTEV